MTDSAVPIYLFCGRTNRQLVDVTRLAMFFWCCGVREAKRKDEESEPVRIFLAFLLLQSSHRSLLAGAPTRGDGLAPGRG